MKRTKKQVRLGCRFAVRNCKEPVLVSSDGFDSVERVGRGLFVLRLSNRWSRSLLVNAVLCPTRPTRAAVMIGEIDLKKKSIVVKILKTGGDISKSIMWDYPRTIASVCLQTVVE
jgi:hypothetical protein